MKIGLVDFGSKRIIMDQNIPHLGLAYVAAVLELHGHQIHMLDSNQAGRKVTEEFISNTYDVIGLSATSFTYNQTNEFAAKMRSHNKEAIIVIGGPHVAIGMETVLDSPSFDYAVCGEGEYTMLDLVTILEKSRQPKCDDLYAIKGLIFRDKGKPVATPRRQRINSLDELPFPAFHLLQMEHYGFYPLLTSRGCPFGCSFCSIKAIWGTLWTHRSVDNIIQEIEYARGKLHWEKKPFNLIDDSFNVVPKRVMEFCERLIESGLNILWFSSGFRADRVPYELACKMKESGCIGVSVGIESSNDETLKRIKKGETIDQITEGCRNLSRAGIPVQAQFMIGNPGDTFETVKASIQYAKKENISEAAFYLALPYPKTALWDYVKNNGRFLEKDYTEFHHFSDAPVFDTPEFSKEERIKAYKLARKLALQTKLKRELKSKLERFRRLDFHDLDLKRVLNAIARICKYSADLALGKKEKV
jgi:radical SAM superfamily enzyme YgiQ (UPF0313 family)